MSKYRSVDTSFWSDPWVVDHLNPHDRYLFLYLFTNAHVNLAGIYEVSLRTIAYETGIEKEELLRGFKRLEPKVKYIDGWVILQNSIKNQNYHSPKVQANIEFILSGCPPELMDFIDWPKDYGKPKPEGTMQTNLLTDVDDFDGKNKRRKNVVKTDNIGVTKMTTRSSVKYGMDTVSPNTHTYTNTKTPPVNGRAAGSKIDQELAAKEQAAKHRKTGNGYKSFATVGETLKNKKLKKDAK